MKLPWVSRRYAELLEKENARLLAMNEGLIRNAFSIRGLGDPLYIPQSSGLSHPPMGRKTANQLIAELEAKERVSAAPAEPKSN